MRQVLARDATARDVSEHGLHVVCWTDADVVKEARPQKHTYVCSEERTAVCHTVVMRTEVRAPQTSAS